MEFWDVESTSHMFNKYLDKAVEKIKFGQPLEEVDELILEAASIIMQLTIQIDEDEETLSEVNQELDKLDKLVEELLSAKDQEKRS